MLLIFDLDGVLIDSKDWHFEAVNEAILFHHGTPLTYEEHINGYDGLSTLDKVIQLHMDDKIPMKVRPDEFNDTKQLITRKKLENLKADNTLIGIFKNLSEFCKIAVCTNSVRQTAYNILSRLGLMPYISLIVSNEDVKSTKPHPEMYWKAMSEMRFGPQETLIVEDSPNGLLAAQMSGAKVRRVNGPKDIQLDWIYEEMFKMEDEEKTAKWQDDNLTVLIPMAGAGSRFAEAGYTFPKPLIEVLGKPMIQQVVENIDVDAKFVFVVQKEHEEKYNITNMLKLIKPNCEVVIINGLTGGAAITTLAARGIIDPSSKLFIANSDQYVDWNPMWFFYKMQTTDADAGIVTFEATHPKWSFARVENGLVTEVAEKNPISKNATVGFYYFKTAESYFSAVDQMMTDESMKVNGEYYVAPTFNVLINNGAKVIPHMVKGMNGLGTPEDLNSFLEKHGE